MTSVRVPGLPVIEAGELISTHPATGVEVGRFPVATRADVERAVERGAEAGRWWEGLGFAERRRRLLRWRAVLARRIEELADLSHREGGKPVAEAIVETAGAIEHIDWAARNAKRVLGPRRVPSRLVVAEFAGRLEYRPYGVVGVISPWNYPVKGPIATVAYALAAGNAVVLKPSEYTPAVGQWLVDTFTELVDDQPVLQAVHGLGDTGNALCQAPTDKIAFTGSTTTAKKVMTTCAATLTPVLIEAGGKDAIIIDSDADLDAAADACVWGALTNAGQTCIGIERAYATAAVYDDFLQKVIDKAGKLTVGPHPADIGPITMPAQIDIIRHHITDALDRGAHAPLGGPDAIQPPYVHPTILTNVPPDAAALTEETFGPTLTITRVTTTDEAISHANNTRYGLGAAVFAKRNATAIARQLRTGMVAINSVLSFTAVAGLPYGGVGDSGFGRTHGDDGLREFSRSQSIARRRGRSPMPTMTFERTPAQVARIARMIRRIYGR